MLRNPRAEKTEQLVDPGSPLGRVEAVLRAHGRLGAAELAALTGIATADLPTLIDRHPLIYRDGAGRYGIIAKLPPDLADPEIAPSKLTTPVAGHVTIVCPVCGLRHRVPAGVRRKIERRARSARCAGCTGYGPAVTLSLGPLPPEQFEVYGTWWLLRFSDEQIARMAVAMFDEGAAELVRAWRARLQP